MKSEAEFRRELAAVEDAFERDRMKMRRFREAAERAREERLAAGRKGKKARSRAGQSPTRPPTPARSASGAPAILTVPLPVFAQDVMEAAQRSRTGWFGDNKVFINHVMRALLGPRPSDANALAFRQRLIQAHRGRLLSLSRADLVEAMDPTDVAESDTYYLSEVFNFVRVPENRARR